MQKVCRGLITNAKYSLVNNEFSIIVWEKVKWQILNRWVHWEMALFYLSSNGLIRERRAAIFITLQQWWLMLVVPIMINNWGGHQWLMWGYLRLIPLVPLLVPHKLLLVPPPGEEYQQAVSSDAELRDDVPKLDPVGAPIQEVGWHICWRSRTWRTTRQCYRFLHRKRRKEQNRLFNHLYDNIKHRKVAT